MQTSRLVPGDCDIINSIDSVWPIQAACIVTREVRIPKYFVHICPWILTKDLHLHLSLQVDAVLDPLSVRICNDLYTFTKPL